MVETFLSPVIERLTELLIDEAKSLKKVRRDVESLKDELEIIQPFLRDTEAKSEKGEVNDATKVWLKQIRKQAERIEDVVDNYLYHVEQDRHQGESIGLLGNAGQFIKSLRPRYHLASEIQDIQNSLHEIKGRGVGYGLRPLEDGSISRMNNIDRHNPCLRSRFMEDDEIICINGASRELISRLIAGLSMRSVTSLVGQGGIGKTTLATKVYNHEAVKAHFDCNAWITVSQSHDIKKLLRILIRNVRATGERIEEDSTKEELITVLRQHLHTKRYMIVLDDVWHSDFWEDMRHAFPNNDKGSRIIITTRNIATAESCKENSCDLVQMMQSWSLEMGWLLFCKKAFRNEEIEGCCPPQLEQLSREIISKCQGLPLAISTIAGLLSTKEKVEYEWRKVLDDLNSTYRETNVPKILSLSYIDLPYHLKLCFLYFGIFPKDSPVVDVDLYRLWIAEGFVKERNNKPLVDVAKEYLDELIQRNVVSFELLCAMDRHCKVHDLMHDIISERGGELGFGLTLNESESNLEEKSRRLSIHRITENVWRRVSDSSTRSVFLFGGDECADSFVSDLFKKSKLLRVLYFKGAPLNNLPEEVGNLFHLKYLCLMGTKVKVIPKSIANLHNLQSLDIRNTLVQVLPTEVNELRNLQRLAAYSHDKTIQYSVDSICGVRMGEGIGKLKELHTLSCVEAYPSKVGFVEELQKLTKLKCLGISKVTAEMGNSLGVFLQKMNQLEQFTLRPIKEDEVIDLNYISSHPAVMRYLKLTCRLQQLPNWISKLHHLLTLDLSFSRLIEEPLKCLKDLPNLAFLRMHQAYEGEELHFQEGGFQKLKELELHELEGLKVMKIDEGALPLLERLDFGPSPLMNKMPSDIQHLTKLKSFGIYDMPREFVVDLQPGGGAEYWKIQHVPYVTFSYYQRGILYIKYKLGSSQLLQSLQNHGN